MATLLDQLLRHRKLAPALRGPFTDSTIIKADNVYDYCVANEVGSMLSLLKLPKVTPPLKHLFIEHKLPKPAGGSFGWFFKTVDADKKAGQPDPSIKLHGPLPARWIVRGLLFVESGIPIPQMWCQVLINEHGAIIEVDDYYDAGKFAGGPVPYHIRPAPENVLAQQLWKSDPYGEWNLPSVLSLNVAIWAICFMHTKNVIQEEITPPEKLSKSHRRKYGRGLLSYKTIKVMPIRKQAAKGIYKSADRAPSALHIVRGHFKTFSEDAPLFGKWAGQFWWPQLLRGNKGRGIVEKDYEVKP